MFEKLPSFHVILPCLQDQRFFKFSKPWRQPPQRKPRGIFMYVEISISLLKGKTIDVGIHMITSFFSFVKASFLWGNIYIRLIHQF